MLRSLLLRTPFAKTLRDHARSLLLWAGGIAAYVALIMAAYPSVRDSAGQMQGYIEALPDGFKAAFFGDLLAGAFFEPVGFLNTEVCSWLAPFVFIAFGVATGARALAGEEEAGTLGLVLAYPLRRSRLVLQKFAALVALVAALGVVFWLVLVASDVVMELRIGAGPLAQASLLLTLLGLAFGALTFAAGAATGRRGLALAVGSGVALAMYLLNTLASINEAVRPYRALSLFHAAGGPTPIGHGLHAADLAVLVGAVLAALAAALLLFARRDVRA